jgi:hypothetical protein
MCEKLAALGAYHQIVFGRKRPAHSLYRKDFLWFTDSSQRVPTHQRQIKAFLHGPRPLIEDFFNDIDPIRT